MLTFMELYKCSYYYCYFYALSRVFLHYLFCLEFLYLSGDAMSYVVENYIITEWRHIKKYEMLTAEIKLYRN